MSPGGHLMTAVLAAGAGLVLTGSAPLAAGIVAGGFLIDVDHLADYLIVERRHDSLRLGPPSRARRLLALVHLRLSSRARVAAAGLTPSAVDLRRSPTDPRHAPRAARAASASLRPRSGGRARG